MFILQIQLDCKLLEQIFNFSSSLEKQSGDKGYVRNALRTIGFAIAGKMTSDYEK